jgi:ATP-dependent Clp protease ATP-binding subunit ClpC
VFERFTERARHAVVLAQDEARALKHNYIGTEHLLLGLLREHGGLAACALDSLGIRPDDVRAEVVQLIGEGDEAPTDEIPFTPRAKKVFELGLREARSLGDDCIGTEHVLLGVARESEGVAARILLDLGADPEKIRNEIASLLPERPADGAAPSPDEPRRPTVRGWWGRLRRR